MKRDAVIKGVRVKELEYLPIIIAIHDTENKIVWANLAYREATGLAPQEIEGKKCHSVWGLDKPCRNCPAIKAMETGEPAETELTPENQDLRPEKKRSWLSKATPLRNNDDTIIGAIELAIEITQSKQTEQALRESEEQYRQLFENMSSGVAVYRPVDNGKNFVIVDFNIAAEKIENTKKKTIIGKRVTEAFPGVEDFGLFQVFQRVWRTGQSEYHPAAFYQDNRIVGWRENRVYKLPSGLIVTIYNDITDRKQAEQALKKVNNILTKSPGVAFTWQNYKNWPVEFVTDNVEMLFGYTSKDFTSGRISYADCISKDDLERVRNEVESFSAEKDRTEFKHTPYRIVTKEGKERIISDWTFIVRDEQGNVTHYEGIIEDITDRIRVEAEHKKLQDQLIQAQKMESVGRMAGGIAHDFNNMLSVILGYAELSANKMGPKDPVKKNLNEIIKAARHSANITRQLLAFARKQTIAPKVVDLNQLVATTLKMLQRLIGEDIDLLWQPEADLWLVNVDPSQIDQILANLCVNARDAISGVGKLIIETHNIYLDHDYCANHAGFVPGEYVRLTVSDNGCGMDREIIDKIFEPFFTTKDSSKGTGLGLSMVYGIVKQNRGFINVYSEPEHGTTFNIYFPRHATKTTTTKFKRAEVTTDALGSETILLVEDEPAILEITKMMLEQLGYTVLPATAPSAAIRVAEEHAGEIHLLITDVVMPEMNGRDLARNLLDPYPDLKCLFMSGYTANIISHQGVLDEGVNFIQKPFLIKDLAEKVRSILDENR
jgi:PAS domain S-box-containing protein